MTGSGNLGRTPKVPSRLRVGMWSALAGNEVSGTTSWRWAPVCDPLSSEEET